MHYYLNEKLCILGLKEIASSENQYCATSN